MSYIMIIYELHFCVSGLYETYRIIASVWPKKGVKM